MTTDLTPPHGLPRPDDTELQLADLFYERFAHRTEFADCWEWQGCTTGGYGSLTIRNRTATAHRWAWTLLVGPIPDGIQLDHLCRVRHCVNPDHLELVTPEAHADRRAVKSPKIRYGDGNVPICKRGHALASDADWIIRRVGNRQCRKCWEITHV